MLDPTGKVPRPAVPRGAVARGAVLALALLFGAAACDDARSASDDESVRMIPAPTLEPSEERSGDAVSGDPPVAEAPGSPPAGSRATGSDDAGAPGPDAVAAPVRAVEGVAAGEADDEGTSTGDAKAPRADVPSDDPDEVAPPSRPRTVRRAPSEELPVDREPEPADLERTDRGGMTLHFGEGAAARRPALPAGARVEAVMETGISTGTSRPGDPFRARLADDVIAADGLVLIPRGSVIRGRVVESRESDASDRPAVITLGTESVVIDGRSYALTGTVVDVEMEAGTRASSGQTATKIGVGAAAGAVLGKILGGDGSDALKGAAAGAAAGAAVALATRDGHASIAEGARLVVRLDRPLVLDGGR